MAKTARVVALAICIACSLFEKCTTEITDQSTVDTILSTSPDVQLITKNTSSEYILEPNQTLSLTTDNMNKENRTDIPLTQGSRSDNHSIDSVIPISSTYNEEQTSLFSSEAIIPSTTLSTYSHDEKGNENVHYLQTPGLNSTLFPSLPQNPDSQTYFTTESLQSEYLKNNYTSLNLTRLPTILIEPTTPSYDNISQNFDEPNSFSNPIDQDAVTKIIVNTTENIEISESEVFKIPRMGKEVTISALDKTIIAEVSATNTSDSSEMMHTTNLPDIESKMTIVDYITNIASVSQNQSYDSSILLTNDQDLFSIESGKKVNENASNNLPNTKNVVLILKKDCAGVNIFQNMFAVLNTHLMGLLSTVSGQNTNINTVNCDAFFHLKLSIDSATDQVIKEVAHILLSNISLGEDLKVEKVFLNTDEYEKFSMILQTSNNDDNEDGLFIKREIIAYIVAGICLGLFIGTLMACCCARLFCKKQTNSLDLCDIPHLNLKLEDYKLTPIPRPTISFPEYGRELFNPAYNDPAPRIEDTILNQHHFSGDTTNSMAKDSGSHSREMRTFGGKKSCSRVQSLDVRPNMRGGNGWISNSTEKLNTDFEKKGGFDNSGFRKWF